MKKNVKRRFCILGSLLLGYRDSALSSHISVYLDARGRNQSLHKAGQSLLSQQTVPVLPDDGLGFVSLHFYDQTRYDMCHLNTRSLDQVIFIKRIDHV